MPRNGPLRESDRPEGPGHGRTRIVRTGPDWGPFVAPRDRSFSPVGTPDQAPSGLLARVPPSGGIALLESMHALIGANDDEPVALLERKRVWIERRNRVALPLHRHYGASRFRTDVSQGDTAEVLRNSSPPPPPRDTPRRTSETDSWGINRGDRRFFGWSQSPYTTPGPSRRRCGR